VAPAERPPLFAAVAEQRPECLRVLVVADPTDGELSLLDGARAGHGVVQLHGSETVQRCWELRRCWPGLLWWKALRIRSAADLAQAAAYTPVVDALLLDAWVPDQLGGTGHRLPLEWLAEFDPPLPWWLAGGITPERVGPVLAAVRPDGLDVSSGVEDAPGHKNLARVAQLVAAVGAARNRGAADS
jgi:phosphoribosylanthranilate isomerase